MKPAVLAAAVCAAALSIAAQAQQTTLTVAAFPAVDKIVKSAIPAFKKLHPNVEIKVVGREYADHHTAMIDRARHRLRPARRDGGRARLHRQVRRGGGLEDLAKPPLQRRCSTRAKFVPFTIPQATSTQRRARRRSRPTSAPARCSIARTSSRRPASPRADLTTHAGSRTSRPARRSRPRPAPTCWPTPPTSATSYIRTGLKDGEGVFFDKNGKVLVDSPRFVRAFELAKQTRDGRLDAKIGAWSNEWTEGLQARHASPRR